MLPHRRFGEGFARPIHPVIEGAVEGGELGGPGFWTEQQHEVESLPQGLLRPGKMAQPSFDEVAHRGITHFF